MQNWTLSELDSGERVISERLDHVRSVAVGYWIGAGARDETPEQAGVTHFIEHLLFKGSKRFDALEIAEIFDGLGGELNAATSREHTLVYSRVPDNHLETALDVMGDMVFAPLFEELDAEREVVLEEIAMYEDTPQELVHDLIAEAVFGDHPLGRPVIGTADVISSLPRDAIAEYHTEMYSPRNIVVAAAGNVEHGRTLVGRVAGALQAIGQQCQSAGMVSAMTSLAASAARPLPPMLAGLRGGYFVLNQLKMGPQGPQQLDGFGTVQLDHTADLLKLATSELPSFTVPLDGKAHPLPAMLPFPGHVAASETSIGVGVGSNSAVTAVDAIQGKSGPAPLLLMQYDYSRFGELMGATMPKGAEAAMMFDMFKMFGIATVQMVADARGLVMWTAIEIR